MAKKPKNNWTPQGDRIPLMVYKQQQQILTILTQHLY